MGCDVINIPSPTGDEGAMGVYMRAVMESLGLRVTWQEVEEGRANVVGLWEGAGGGPGLMFNGHMDTSNTGQEIFLTGAGYKPHAIVRDGMIFGPGHLQHEGRAGLLRECRARVATRGSPAARRRNHRGRCGRN